MSLRLACISALDKRLFAKRLHSAQTGFRRLAKLRVACTNVIVYDMSKAVILPKAQCSLIQAKETS